MSVILKHPPSDHQLREQVKQVMAAWKETLGLNFNDEGTLTDNPQLKIDVWTEEDDPTIEINLVRDDVAGVRYLSAIADDESVRRRLWAQLAREFPIASVEDLQQDVRRRGETDPGSYLRLALAAGDAFDETSIALVREGLRSPHAAVRAQAAMAAGLVAGPDLADAAEAALMTETDEGVARLLKAAVALGREGRL
jgi:hypothetical protein